MMSVRLALPLVFVSLAISGCSHTHIPSPADLPIVYKIDVQQGNVVTQDMLAQLKPGMDRGKVKFIMGTPLIADTFHNDRWDYIFTMQERGGERTQRRVSVYFKDDKLVSVAGDVKRAAGAIAASDENAAKTVEVPAAEKGLVERMKDKVGGGNDKKTAATKEATPAADAAKTDAAAAGNSTKTETTAAAKSDAPAESAKTETSGTAAATEATAKESTDQTTNSASKTESGGDFVIDNSNGTATKTESTAATDDKATTVPAPSAADSSLAEQPAAAAGKSANTANKDIMPRFRSESDLDAEDTTAPSASTDATAATETAAEAASGSDVKASESAAGGTGKSTTVAVPDTAPQPKKKGFFRRLLEKVGVGDNEDGEYQSTDPKYKDVSNPEVQSH